MARKHEFSSASRLEGVSNSKICVKDNKKSHEHDFDLLYIIHTVYIGSILTQNIKPSAVLTNDMLFRCYITRFTVLSQLFYTWNDSSKYKAHWKHNTVTFMHLADAFMLNITVEHLMLMLSLYVYALQV